jgi:hypothetical protein
MWPPSQGQGEGAPAPFLDERTRRLVAASEVRTAGRGGIAATAAATGTSGWAASGDRANLRTQRGVRRCPPRRLPLRLCMVAAGGDTQQPAYGGNQIVRLVIAHKPESRGGIAFVSRANQAAAPGSCTGRAFDQRKISNNCGTTNHRTGRASLLTMGVHRSCALASLRLERHISYFVSIRPRRVCRALIGM